MQATIYPISPFDALNGATIKFGWNGERINKNRCIIRDAETNEIAYDNTVYNEMFKMEHVIDLSVASLKNGRKYYAYLTVIDMNNIESDIQTMGQPFICLKTPEFYFENIFTNYVLQSSNGEFVLHYHQENGELLDSWQISVYHNDSLVSSSNVVYDTTLLSYTFSGFEDGEKYKIRATGTTINGWLLDTKYIDIIISYKTAAVFSMIDLINLPRHGAVMLQSNITSADGETINPAEFIDGEFIDLRNNELTYDEGFMFEGNFSTVAYAYDVIPNIPFLYFKSSDDESFEGLLTYRTCIMNSLNKMGCVELRIREGAIGLDMVCYSNKINPIAPDDLLGVNIMRQNGHYDVEISNLGNAEQYHNTETNEEILEQEE